MKQVTLWCCDVQNVQTGSRLRAGTGAAGLSSGTAVPVKWTSGLQPCIDSKEQGAKAMSSF